MCVSSHWRSESRCCCVSWAKASAPRAGRLVASSMFENTLAMLSIGVPASQLSVASNTRPEPPEMTATGTSGTLQGQP